MPVEIERKFLVLSDAWRKAVTHSVTVEQGYLSFDTDRTVRVRIIGDDAYITIKGKTDKQTLAKPEYEYSIPIDDARALMKMCHAGRIRKTRHYIPAGAHTWEVDEFHDDNAGLIVAEIELSDQADKFAKPVWLGQEVTGDKRYANAKLSQTPFTRWAA